MEKNQALMHFYFTTPTLNALKTAPKVESEKKFCRPSELVFYGFFVESEPNGRFGDVYILTPACLPAAKKTWLALVAVGEIIWNIAIIKGLDLTYLISFYFRSYSQKWNYREHGISSILGAFPNEKTRKSRIFLIVWYVPIILV